MALTCPTTQAFGWQVQKNHLGSSLHSWRFPNTHLLKDTTMVPSNLRQQLCYKQTISVALRTFHLSVFSGIGQNFRRQSPPPTSCVHQTSSETRQSWPPYTWPIKLRFHLFCVRSLIFRRFVESTGRGLNSLESLCASAIWRGNISAPTIFRSCSASCCP